jgi:Icc-related predicted phosphoesterase
MHLVATSDLHGYLPEIPACDLILIGGDICPDGTPQMQADWLDTCFRRWLKGIPAKEVVAVAGNHDFLFEQNPEIVPALPWHYLQDSGLDIEGVRIWGTPWQPVFFDWAFNQTEPELEKIWKQIPANTDILLLHGPPFRHGDRNTHGEHTGSPSLLTRIREVQPKVVICGHIHESRGQYHIGSSRILNVSQLNVHYQPHDNVIEFDWPL